MLRESRHRENRDYLYQVLYEYKKPGTSTGTVYRGGRERGRLDKGQGYLYQVASTSLPYTVSSTQQVLVQVYARAVTSIRVLKNSLCRGGQTAGTLVLCSKYFCTRVLYFFSPLAKTDHRPQSSGCEYPYKSVCTSNTWSQNKNDRIW